MNSAQWSLTNINKTPDNIENARKMIERLLIVGRRHFHSATSELCKFKFTAVETQKILSVVNNCDLNDLTARFAITPTRAKNLLLSRQRSGKNVDSIDEVLSVGGFSVNVLNQFCRSILNEGTSTESENDMWKKARNRSFTLPPISNNLVKHINSFTSIHCGLAGLSWSTFKLSPGENTKISHWDWRPLPDEKLNLYHLAVFMTNALKDVPKSDFYVFENPNVPNVGSTSKLSLNVQISQMVGMASVITAQNNTLPIGTEEGMELEPGTINVAYLRKFLFARLFKLYVGAERISATNYVEDLIRITNISAVMDENVQTVVDVDLSLKAMYSTAKSSDKDFLGCSFLLGLAFLRLSLLKCPKSMKLVGK